MESRRRLIFAFRNVIAYAITTRIRRNRQRTIPYHTRTFLLAFSPFLSCSFYPPLIPGFPFLRRCLTIAAIRVSPWWSLFTYLSRDVLVRATLGNCTFSLSAVAPQIAKIYLVRRATDDDWVIQNRRFLPGTILRADFILSAPSLLLRLSRCLVYPDFIPTATPLVLRVFRNERADFLGVHGWIVEYLSSTADMSPEKRENF